MRKRDDRSCSRLVQVVISTVAGAVVALVMSSGTALAQEQPLDGVSPSSTGMPGAALVRQLLSWGFWLGLAACGGAIIYGAAQVWLRDNGYAPRVRLVSVEVREHGANSAIYTGDGE